MIPVSICLDIGSRRYKEASKRVRQLSLTWSLLRKTVLVNKGREVARLREVLLVRVQFCIHVVQGPLMTGGGGQLLLVCGVVVLRVVGGCFICGRRLLQHKGGDRDSQREEGGIQADNSERDVQRVLGTHLGWVRQWGFLWRPLHSESITEKKKNNQSRSRVTQRLQH